MGSTGLAYGFAGGLVGALSSRLAARRRGRIASPWAGWRWDRRGCVTGGVCGGALWFYLRPVFGPSAALIGASANAVLYGAAGGAFGSVATTLSSRRRSQPAMRTHWSWDWRAFRVSAASGPALGCIYWTVLTIQTDLTGIDGYAFTAMLPFICAYGLTLGLACGLKSKHADLAGAVGPTTLLLQDRHTFWKLWSVVGGTVCAAFLLCFGIAYVSHAGPLYGLSYSTPGLDDLPVTPANILTTGLTYGITVGFAAGLSQTASWEHLLARSYLFLRRRLPWHLTAFLADAHESRGVLRQVGAAYQFSHIDLQHHLAASTPPGRPRTPRTRVPAPRSSASTPSSRPGRRH
jgi:hypothetical protein